MLRTALTLGLLIGTLSTVDARAPAPAKTNPAKTKLAKQYVDAGLAAQNAKDFETAIAMYTKAYEVVPVPVLLFNIAQAHRLAGRDVEAKQFYERYLADEPAAGMSSIAREFLAELKAKQDAAAKAVADARAAADAKRAADAKAIEDAKAAADAKRAADAKLAAEASAARAREQAAADETARHQREAEEARAARGRPLRIAGIATAGAGVVSLGVAVMFGLRAGSLSDELSAPDATFDPDKVSRGESAEKLSIISGVAGGALITGGVVLYFLGYTQKAERIPGVSVVADPTTAGIAFSGRF